MSRYKLPDALGGAEFDGEYDHGPNLVWWTGPTGGKHPLPRSVLTEVVTTPAEPEPGAYLINGVLCVRFPSCRWARQWSVQTEGMTGGCVWHKWEDAVEALGGPGVTIQRLVPAPPEVELPWAEDTETVSVDKSPRIRGVYDSPSWLSADLAERKAYALLAAARAAREAS